MTESCYKYTVNSRNTINSTKLFFSTFLSSKSGNNALRVLESHKSEHVKSSNMKQMISDMKADVEVRRPLIEGGRDSTLWETEDGGKLLKWSIGSLIIDKRARRRPGVCVTESVLGKQSKACDEYSQTTLTSIPHDEEQNALKREKSFICEENCDHLQPAARDRLAAHLHTGLIIICACQQIHVMSEGWSDACDVFTHNKTDQNPRTDLTRQHSKAESAVKTWDSRCKHILTKGLFACEVFYITNQCKQMCNIDATAWTPSS